MRGVGAATGRGLKRLRRDVKEHIDETEADKLMADLRGPAAPPSWSDEFPCR
jgi:hypothetical protein